MRNTPFDAKAKAAEACSEALIAELRRGLAAVENYAEQHGSFAEFVREHYERGLTRRV